MSEPLDFPDPLEGFENLEDLVKEHEVPAEPVFEPTPEPLVAAIPPPAPPVMPSKPWKSGMYRPSPWRAVACVFGLAGVLVIAAIAAMSSLPTPPAPAAPAAAPASEPSPDPSKLALTRLDGLDGEIKVLAKSLDAMKAQLAAAQADLAPIEAKIDAVAKKVDDGSPKVDTIQVKLDALSKKIDAGFPDAKGIDAKIEKSASSLSSRIAALTTKTEALEKALAAAKATVAALQADKKESTAAKPPASNAAEADFAKAVDVYRQNKFAEARASFSQLQTSMPTDARVWYYAALSNGFATGDWNAETVRLVNKGIELERAGTPDSTKIDAAFADLASPTAKTWLDAYRVRAK